MAPRNIKQIEATLREIFEFYGSTVTGAVLKSAKFQKLALDADLVDERLTSAKIDLIFKKICGSIHPMTFPNFMDAIVLLSVEKYPLLPPQQATLRIYDDHFSTFKCPVESVFDNIENDFFDAVEPFKAQLQALYARYFQVDTHTYFTIKRNAAPSSHGLKAFGNMMADFEVTPFLVSKAVVFATFREVAKAQATEKVKERLGELTLCPQFTFAHFLVGLLRVAHKLYPQVQGDSNAFVQLLERMDAVNPAKALFFVDNATRSRKSGFSPAPRCTASRSSRGSVDRSRTSLERSRASLERSTRASRADASRTSMESRTNTSTGSGDMDERRRTYAGDAAPSARERLVSQLFGYYAALGNPLNRKYISTLKWNRFLRDAKLLPTESGRSSEYRSARLSHIDADLIFVQAVGKNVRHHMSVRTFEIGLHLIAEKLYGKGGDSFAQLCDAILSPLSERLLELHGQDVTQCAIAMAEPEMVALFSHALDGVARLFHTYARNGVLTPECFARFCTEFDITQDMSHMPLQRIFSDCVNVEYSAGHGNLNEMSLLSFQLALVLIAEKVGKEGTMVSKVAQLFRRLNAVALSHGLHPHARGTFLPVDKEDLASSPRKVSPKKQTNTWTDLMQHS